MKGYTKSWNLEKPVTQEVRKLRFKNHENLALQKFELNQPVIFIKNH